MAEGRNIAPVKKVIIKKYKICVVGAGHVGLVAAACFAELGHKVICVDSDREKIKDLKKTKLPFYEPELEPLVKKNFKHGNLLFSFSLCEAIKRSDVIFIAVGTPPQADGSADLCAVENVARVIADNLNSYKLVVSKSTVPVCTGQRIKDVISRYGRSKNNFDVASNPEFLREGKAVYDFFYPDRIVLGVESKPAETILRTVYASIKAPVLVTDINTAELIKHASNSFLAAKISFINAVARICDLAGADVEKVAQGMGLDKRIGREFLNAGLGYGGFCVEGKEKIIVRDENCQIKSIPAEELFQQFKQEQFSALSFDIANNKTCFNDITLVSQRDYSGKIIELETAMKQKIKVTSDHPMLVWNGHKLSVICADEVHQGCLLPLFTRMPDRHENIMVDLFESTNYKKMISSTGYQRINDDFCVAKVRKKTEYYVKQSKVYSLEVKNTNTFTTAEGIIVHNCFPKDVDAFIYIAGSLGYDFEFLKAVRNVNEQQWQYFLEKVKEHLWILKNKTITILGLAFKPDTDDLRFAPAIRVVETLLKEDARIYVYDPQAMPEAKKIFSGKNIIFAKNPYQAVKNSDCLCLLTEWQEFKDMDLAKIKGLMRYPFIADARNMFCREKVKKLGFKYAAIGRP